MKLIKVAAAVLNQTPRDWKGNYQRIVKALRQAKLANVNVLCLPEATITGYGLEDDLFCADVPDRALNHLGLLLENEKSTIAEMTFCVGLPVRFNNSLYNTVATVVCGEVVGLTCKQHLAGDGIHYENRWFKPWPKGVVQNIKVFGKEIPIGDIHFQIGGTRGFKLGYEICEDAWVAGRPGTILASKGVDIYLNPSASHFAFGKLNTRKNFVVDGSRAFNATYVYANLVGNEAGRAIYDGGALIASGGNLLAEGDRLTFKDVSLTTAIVDVDLTKTQNVRTASFEPDNKNYNEGCVFVPYFVRTTLKHTTSPINLQEWENSPNLKHEECTRALGLALMDYMRKSKTNGFVVSLSGGADSAMVTYLCAQGIRLGVAELGLREFIEKYCRHLWRVNTVDELVAKLITTAYQPTNQSGSVTKTAAAVIAEGLGVPHYVLDVQEVFDDYMSIGKLINGGKDLTFKENGLVLQNLQARVRAPSIWMIANLEGKLLLTTSNMSEAAVGYATMDGDTAGCVAPIAGLPKCYIREYLNWVETDGPVGIGEFPQMNLINNQAPTAELLPKEYNQTDETDLMPYWLLHKIESLVVKNRYIPIEIYEELKATIEYDNNQLIEAIKKFFRLFSMNQWKRERYALSFHVDDHNLDPRTWCRTPILTGGYEEELAELDEFIVK